jgi:endoglucanase
VDPSYWMPGVVSALAKLTGDERWSKAAAAVVAVVGRSSPDQLPPDWAVLQGDRYVPSGSDTSSNPQYGADAQRMPIWFGYGCSDDAKKLAASWWKRLGDHPGAQVRGLDGTAYDPQASVVALEGEAAAADAAGDSDAAKRLRTQAAAQGKASPGYYGDAWLALAGALVDGSLAC